MLQRYRDVPLNGVKHERSIKVHLDHYIQANSSVIQWVHQEVSPSQAHTGISRRNQSNDRTGSSGRLMTDIQYSDQSKQKLYISQSFRGPATICIIMVAISSFFCEIT